MRWHFLNTLTKCLCAVFSRDTDTLASQPQSHHSVAEQLSRMPVLRRGVKWTPEGDLQVVEVRHDEYSGIHLKTTRTIRDEA